VGSWHVQNALGIDGVTVLLQVAPRSSTSCDEVPGQIHYLGKKTQYTISAEPLDAGKLHVKFLNNEAIFGCSWRLPLQPSTFGLLCLLAQAIMLSYILAFEVRVVQVVQVVVLTSIDLSQFASVRRC
ncbi:unnamed protein product, partial [Effrenium voratum]